MTVSTSRLIILSAAFLSLSANWQFFSTAANAFPPSEGNVLFLCSLAVVHACVLALLLLAASSRYTFKPVLTVLLMVAASAAYFSDHFGSVIDDTMILNMAQTDIRETLDLVTLELIARLLLLGVLPILLLWRVRIRRNSWRSETRMRMALAGGVIITIVSLILLFGSSYASFFREFKPVRYYATPTYPIYSLAKFIGGGPNVLTSGPITEIAEDATLAEGDTHRELMILVIGETARADHLSLYGYPRDTNPVLSKMDEIYTYQNVSACGTSTAVSVPCIFSDINRADFNVGEAGASENLLDVLKRVGVSVLWRDNNSDSKGVALRVDYQDFKTPERNPVCDDECRDVGMLDGLQEYIDAQSGDVLIVLHQMGNHGPAYYKRYPPEFEHFTPACQSNKLSECSNDEIINAYDNAIRYTDWFLGQVIDFLKKNQDGYESMMLYVSDHGESLGEYGMYLHGAPYAFAPSAQTNVPLIIWEGEENDIDEESLAELELKGTSHDAIYSSVLTFFEVNTTDIESDLELFRLDNAE
ncbi:MAG: phosphoethanolamine--lipid A transferase [Alcanivoracaceae bacterium]|nr:phosphoethanolamine--lipid A transferase [Alcanivoracaceae bacterium]